MSFSHTHIRLLFVLIAIACFDVVLLGQKSNCLEGCKKKIKIDGKEYTFSYKIILPHRFGSLTFEKATGKYWLDPVEGKDSLRTTIEFDPSNFPKKLTIYFGSKWDLESNFLINKVKCRKIYLENKRVDKLNLWIRPKEDPSESTLKFGAVASWEERRENLCKKYPGFELSFDFALKKNIQVPTSPTTVDNALADETGGEEEEATNGNTVVLEEPNEKEAENEISDNATTEPRIDITDRSFPDGFTTQSNEENAISESNSKNTSQKTSVEVSKRNKIRRAWSKAKTKKTKEAFIKFRNEYPDYGRYVRNADPNFEIDWRDSISYEPPIKLNGGYEIQLVDVFDFYVDTIFGFNAITRIDSLEHKLFVTGIRSNVNITVRVVDRLKPDSVNTIEIPLGDHLDPLITLSADSSMIEKIIFQNGKAPFYVHFFKDEIKKATQRIEEGQREWKPEPSLFTENNLVGEISFKISDSKQGALLFNDSWKVFITEPEDNITLWLMGLALLLLVMVFIYPQLKQAQIKSVTENFLKERSGNLKTALEMQKEQFDAETLQTIEEGGNEFNEEAKKFGEHAGIKITNIKKAAAKAKQYHDEKILERILKKVEFNIQFDTTILWQNTMISSIIFTQKSIEHLDTFLKEQNLKPIQEQEGQIPEIGGILLGRPFLSSGTKTYRVLVEEFVPIAPEYHDKYQLEFSVQSLATDLGGIQDQFPDLMLVGWFHTHPGHGLFLSKPDLRIHDSFFKELYQFAMEIDSLSSNLDTGFFTRMKNGKVNNKRNLNRQAKWYSWAETETEIETGTSS